AVGINLHCSSPRSLGLSALVGRAPLWPPAHNRPRSLVGGGSSSWYSPGAQGAGTERRTPPSFVRVASATFLRRLVAVRQRGNLHARSKVTCYLGFECGAARRG